MSSTHHTNSIEQADIWPLVSVVIPTYKRPDYLSRALHSAALQDYPSLEIVVVDDNPPESSAREETSQLMNEIAVSPPEDREICYVCHEKNAGGAAARNTGAAAARGQYVAFLDDDDSWKPEKTRRQVNLFQASPEPLGLVYTGVRIVHGNGELHRYRAAAYRGYIRDALAIHNVVGTTSSVLIPRHVFHEVGGFDPGFPARQDLDLWFRISQRWPVDYVDEELTIQYRHEEERITHGVDRKLQARQIFLEKYRDFFSNRRRLLAEYHFRTGRYCLQQGQTGQARGYLLRSLGCAPSASALKRLVGSFMVRGNRSGQDADNSTDDV